MDQTAFAAQGQPHILQLVATLHAQGRFEDALRAAAQVLNEGKHDADLLHLAAECSQRLRLYAQAEGCWQRALQMRPNFAAAQFGLAALYSETGKFADAERAYLRVLVIDPAYPNIYGHLGHVVKMQGRMAEAEDYLRRGMALQPDHFLACTLGRLYVDMGRFDAAENYFRHAQAQQPAYAGAWFNLALLNLKRGRKGEAEANFRKAIQLQPDDAATHMMLGNLYAGEERFEEAEDCYLAALRLKPDAAELFSNLGALYAGRRINDKAEAAYCRMMELNPRFSAGLFNYANLLTDTGRFAEAENHYRAALELDPNNAQIYFNYSNMLRLAGRIAEGIPVCRRALELKPGDAEMLNGLGTLFYENRQFDEAEAEYKRALQSAPRAFRPHVNLGILYKMSNRFAEAAEWYARAREIDPDDPLIDYSLALLKLGQGDFEGGWPLYEARHDARLIKPIASKPTLPFPQWRGETLAGKSILVVQEQGFGDVIQFARYTAWLRGQGASVALMVKEPLLDLFATLEGVRIVPFADPNHAPCDYWTLLLSIPLYCGTRLDTIPGEAGYLAAPPAYCDKWRGRVARAGLKVGLVWKGSPTHTGDAERSLASLSLLRPLWDVPGVSFVSLQKGRGEEEAMAAPEAQPLSDLGSRMENFADAAAIIEQLDLVVCVDTAIAHLAGALGKPVWLLVPFAPDWRWLTEREDTPWYPSMRLFRQRTRGDWRPQIERLVHELARLAALHKN